MRRLCYARPVWVSLLGTLQDEESPCLPPHVSLGTVTTSELREAIVNGLRNNRTWSKSGELIRPTSIREVHLPVLPFDQHNWSTRTDMRLLPGGKEVLVENRNIIELWSIEPCEMLGATPACSAQDMCLAFDFELVRGGKGVVIAAIFIDTETCQWHVYFLILLTIR